MSKKGVYGLAIDCGRNGSINGRFVATAQQVDVLLKSGISVYFGSIFGKHSEIYGGILY